MMLQPGLIDNHSLETLTKALIKEYNSYTRIVLQRLRDRCHSEKKTKNEYIRDYAKHMVDLCIMAGYGDEIQK